MSPALEPMIVPLAADADGVLRIGGTRVSLETVVAAFNSGCTCEEIAQQYPALGLSDIYLVTSYYLTHQDALHPYLVQRALQEDRVRTEAPFAPCESNREIRDRLLKRRATG